MIFVTGVFGMAAYSVSKRRRAHGIRIALGAQKKSAGGRWAGPSGSWLSGGRWTSLGSSRAGCWFTIVYRATSRDPVVLAGVVAAMDMLHSLRHGFQRSASCRVIRRYYCARSEGLNWASIFYKGARDHQRS